MMTGMHMCVSLGTSVLVDTMKSLPVVYSHVSVVWDTLIWEL